MKYPKMAEVIFLLDQALFYSPGNSWTSAAISPASFCTFLFQGAALVRPEGPGSSSEENSDCTWTPCPRAKAAPGAPPRKKNKKKQKQKKKTTAGRRARRPLAGAEKRSNASSPLQLKKKCVNGFIMFCRLNRKHFIR